jgi:2-isopropylmalate synthase
VTRVTISPKIGGPNDSPSIHSQSGIYKNRKFSGIGSDTDVVTSSARAYISALNKLLSWNARRIRQADLDEEATNGGSPSTATRAVEAESVGVQRV